MSSTEVSGKRTDSDSYTRVPRVKLEQSRGEEISPWLLELFSKKSLRNFLTRHVWKSQHY